MAKKCPPGKYYCFTDKKCKKIPRGYRIGSRGYLARGDNRSDSDGNDGSNGNGSSNGNGNGGNGGGNGNGGSGGNGGGNGSGGVGESVVYETSNPRIPRKKGQPANSKKHSDLYTDENPKGTIQGLGFKDVAKAKASVSKIRNSSRSHAHKIQAAVAMEQRAREMGKTSEAAVYRKYINSMKKKTKKMNEGMDNHPEFALITVAVDELEKGLMDLEGITYDSVDKLMQGIAKRNNISPTLLHNQFKAKHLTIPDDWAITKRMNKARGIGESKKMTKKQIKKRDEIADAISTREMNKRYGDKNVKYAIATKLAMKEERGRKDLKINPELLASVRKKQEEMKSKQVNLDDKKNKVTDSKEFQKNKSVDSETRKRMNAPENQFNSYELSSDDKYSIGEEGLRSWFGKSSGTTKSGRKVKGWVQVGGKYDGKPCARQPGQKSTPKCVSSSKRRSMSDKERDSAARRKRAADPNQPQKSGAAKPTNVSTDPKKKMSENYFSEKKKVEIKLNPKKKIGVKVTDIGAGGKEYVRKNTMERFKGYADLSHMQTPEQKKAADARLKKANEKSYREQKKKDTKESFVNEAKDKKGKGSGTKDACYHKVKSRYSVWPSAYASGALVKCRKVGAANWGNSTKKEGFSPMQVSALEAAGMIDIKEGQKCWKGYEKKGTKMMFGKRYNNCVKKKATKEEVEIQEMGNPSMDINPAKHQSKTQKIEKMSKTGGPEGEVAKQKLEQAREKETKLPNLPPKVTEGVAFLKREKEKKKSKSEYLTKRDAGKLAKRKMAKKDQEKVNFLEPEETNESKTRLVKNGHTYKVILTWRGKTYMVQMFVPSVSRPTRQEIEKEVQKLYPDAKVMSFLPKDLEPGEPTVMMGEGKKVERDEYGDIVGGPKISKKQLKKNLASNEKDEKITRSEEYVSEDDMKGMSVSSGHKRPTKSGAGMTAKGVAAYRRRNPGSKLKTAVTGKVKKGSKDANRRKSYCARSAGQMKKFPKAAKDPNSRLRQARRRWKC